MDGSRRGAPFRSPKAGTTDAAALRPAQDATVPTRVSGDDVSAPVSIRSESGMQMLETDR